MICEDGVIDVKMIFVWFYYIYSGNCLKVLIFINVVKMIKKLKSIMIINIRNLL